MDVRAREVQVTPTTGGVWIELRPAPSRALRAFGVAAVAVWAAMIFFAWRTLRDPETPRMGVAFMAFWIADFALTGPLALYLFLAARGGREVIAVEGAILSLRRTIGGIGRRRTFDARRVVNLRAEAAPSRLAFDHGSETVRLGAGLATADQERVLAALRGAISPRAA